MPSDSPNAAARMLALFRGHMNAYGTHGTPEQRNGSPKWEIKGTAKTVRAPVTVQLWKNHLDGKTPLGIIPINENNECLWGSIDIDDYTNDLLGIISRIEQEKIPLIPGRSKSGGLHLYLFLTEFVPAALLRTALANVASQLGFANSEIFPKQVQTLSKRGDVGNWIIAPYFGDTYGGKLREQVGLRKTGAELTVDQFIKLAEATKVTPEQLQLLAQHKQAKPNGKAPKTPFGDGPPCLEVLAKMGVPLGGQNNALFHMGVYYRKKNQTDWKERLTEANQEHLSPPGTHEGLMSIVKSLSGSKLYEYTCKAHPMVDYCNSALCRTRRYGVGANFPVISGLRMLDSDPPMWFADVNDEQIELSTTDDLYIYNKFAKVCIEQKRIAFTFIKQSEWQNSLGVVLENCTIIPVSPEVGRRGEFQEAAEEFLTNRQRARSQEELLMGKPWENEEDGKYYFRLQDFQKFLWNKNIREYTRGQLTQRIRYLGGGQSFLKVKSGGKERGVRCWWLSVGIFDEQHPLDIPKINGEQI